MDRKTKNHVGDYIKFSILENTDRKNLLTIQNKYSILCSKFEEISYSFIHMTMNTQQIQKNSGQLAFDFSARTKNLLRKSPILQKHSSTGVVFHGEASTLMEDRFSIKVSLLGRSYRIYGTYRVKQSRSFWNSDEVSREAVGIHYEGIECFMNGRYVRTYISTKDELRLKKETEKILTDPVMNQNLAITQEREFA